MTAAPTPFPADWLAAFTVDELERLAIRTVDGGLTDHEALKDEGLVKRLWIARAKADRVQEWLDK
jgi:hypothetical protein